jgi:ferredoxin
MMKRTFEGWLFNRMEVLGDKEYNHVGCEGEDREFGGFLAQFVPEVGMRKRVKFTIEMEEGGERMTRIDDARCVGCGICAGICPEGIELKEGKASIKNGEAGCLKDAAAACPRGAIMLEGGRDTDKSTEGDSNRNYDQGWGFGQGRGMGAGRGRGMGMGPRDGRGRGMGGGGRRGL